MFELKVFNGAGRVVGHQRPYCDANSQECAKEATTGRKTWTAVCYFFGKPTSVFVGGAQTWSIDSGEPMPDLPAPKAKATP